MDIASGQQFTNWVLSNSSSLQVYMYRHSDIPVGMFQKISYVNFSGHISAWLQHILACGIFFCLVGTFDWLLWCMVESCMSLHCAVCGCNNVPSAVCSVLVTTADTTIGLSVLHIMSLPIMSILPVASSWFLVVCCTASACSLFSLSNLIQAKFETGHSDQAWHPYKSSTVECKPLSIFTRWPYFPASPLVLWWWGKIVMSWTTILSIACLNCSKAWTTVRIGSVMSSIFKKESLHVVCDMLGGYLSTWSNNSR